jgi:hypothetical protein
MNTASTPETVKGGPFGVIDPGHRYHLLTLDGPLDQRLQFVKRCDMERPERFPGNTNSYPGTTIQSVIRCLVDRLDYLQGQVRCKENAVILGFLRSCLWLLEFRAARRHGRNYWHGLRFAAESPMCPKCGHTACEH